MVVSLAAALVVAGAGVLGSAGGGGGLAQVGAGIGGVLGGLCRLGAPEDQLFMGHNSSVVG